MTQVETLRSQLAQLDDLVDAIGAAIQAAHAEDGDRAAILLVQALDQVDALQNELGRELHASLVTQAMDAADA